MAHLLTHRSHGADSTWRSLRTLWQGRKKGQIIVLLQLDGGCEIGIEDKWGLNASKVCKLRILGDYVVYKNCWCTYICSTGTLWTSGTRGSWRALQEKTNRAVIKCVTVLGWLLKRRRWCCVLPWDRRHRSLLSHRVVQGVPEKRRRTGKHN